MKRARLATHILPLPTPLIFSCLAPRGRARVRRGEQVFEVLDSGNKGVIGPDELREVVQQDGMENSEEDVLQLLQGIDIDGSNSLNYREFLAATMEASPVGSMDVLCALGEKSKSNYKFSHVYPSLCFVLLFCVVFWEGARSGGG